MFGLRHATQHERVPVTTSAERYWRDPSGQFVMESYFLLSRADLLEFDWSKCEVGRVHLASLAEDPRVDVLVRAFSEKLGGFVDWFQYRFREAYSQEFQGLEKLNSALATLTQPIIAARQQESRS